MVLSLFTQLRARLHDRVGSAAPADPPAGGSATGLRARGPRSSARTLHRPLRRRRLAGAGALALATMLAVWLIVPRTSGTQVVVATGPIAAGDELSSADVTLRAFPPELVPTGALTTEASVDGATASAPVAAGGVLTEETVLTPRSEPLAEGMVALPVDVGDAAAAEVLRPGHHVRVYAAGLGQDTGGTAGADAELPAGLGAQAGRAVIEEAIVESVAASDRKGPVGSSLVVVLLVTSAEAAALADIAGSTLSFALLN